MGAAGRPHQTSGNIALPVLEADRWWGGVSRAGRPGEGRGASPSPI